MMMIAILLSFGRPSTSKGAIAFFFLYMLIFGGTLNVVPWVYVSPPAMSSMMARTDSLIRVLRSSPWKPDPVAPPSRSRPIGPGISLSS